MQHYKLKAQEHNKVRKKRLQGPHDCIKSNSTQAFFFFFLHILSTGLGLVLAIETRCYELLYLEMLDRDYMKLLPFHSDQDVNIHISVVSCKCSEYLSYL